MKQAERKRTLDGQRIIFSVKISAPRNDLSLNKDVSLRLLYKEQNLRLRNWHRNMLCFLAKIKAQHALKKKKKKENFPHI
jgi:hypothetical protein